MEQILRRLGVGTHLVPVGEFETVYVAFLTVRKNDNARVVSGNKCGSHELDNLTEQSTHFSQRITISRGNSCIS